LYEVVKTFQSSNCSEIFENALHFRNVMEWFGCRSDISLFLDIDSDRIRGSQRLHSVITKFHCSFYWNKRRPFDPQDTQRGPDVSLAVSKLQTATQ